VELFIECVRLFVTTFAIEFVAYAGIATLWSEDPSAGSQWWVMANVLPVTTFQNRAPVIFVIFFKACNLLLHRS